MEEEHITHIHPTKPKQMLSIPAAILVAGLMISFSIYFTGTHPRSGMMGGTPTAGGSEVNVKDAVTAGEPFIGNPNAPVTMVYWTDYQCPFCKRTETDVVPTLKLNYVDTGKMKIVFKDFVFLGDDSKVAALFSRAVWDLYPGAYYAWREAMFAAQDAEGDQGFGDRVSIEKLTSTIPGIDQVRVSAVYDQKNATYQKAIDADYAEGQKFGVQGTPAVIIGTTLISGAEPLTSFTTVIDGLLKK